MAFDRMTINHNPPTELTDADLVVLAKLEKQNNVPVVHPDNPFKVAMFLLPGIAGNPAELASLGSEIIEQSKEIKCQLLRIRDALPKATLAKLPIIEDAAYVRCGDGLLYYVNKIKNECTKIPIKDLTSFDAEMHTTSLDFGDQRSLDEDELGRITRLTGHFHDGRRLIYIYRDNNIFKGWYEKGYLNIEDEAKNIAQEMEVKLPSGPYFIVAYSYSAFLALQVMEYFASKGLDTFIYIVDSPAPELTREFLNSHTPAYVLELLKIVNYTAAICSMKNPATLTEEQIQEFKNYTPAKCMEQIAKLVYEKNGYLKNRQAFDTELNFEKQRLEKIVNYQKEFKKPMPGKIRALITNKTAQLYGDKCGGYPGYMDEDKKIFHPGYVDENNLSFETDPHLTALNHQDLVREENSGRLANSIIQFFDANITPKYLFAKNLLHKMNMLVQEVEEQGDDPDLMQDAKSLQKKVIKKCTPPSTPPDQEQGSPTVSPYETPTIQSGNASPATIHNPSPLVSASSSSLFSTMQAHRRERPGTVDTPGETEVTNRPQR